jgi:drug/metabolite transporter (DMT)-like permease
MATTDERRSIMGLFSDVVDEAAGLFQTELRLLRAEISDKLGRVANSSVALAVGAVCTLAALIMLLQGVVRWLAIAGIPEQWGFLLVGVIVGGLGVGLLLKGVADLKAASLVPQRSIDQIKQDFATMKEHVT